MIVGLIIGLVVAAAGVLGVRAVVKRKDGGLGLLGSSRAQRKLLQGDTALREIDDLRVGDIVQCDTVDYLVEGVIEYDDDGHRWKSGLLVDGAVQRWLTLGMDRVGDGKVRLLEVENEVEISEFPPELLHAGGHRFQYDRRGTATATLSGEVGGLVRRSGSELANTVERCRWWIYQSAGEEVLIVEQWGNEYRVLRGSNLLEGTLTFLPGS